MVQRHRLFLGQGGAALTEMQHIDARLDAIKATVATDFPLDEAQVLAFRENLRGHVLKIQEIEREAIAALQGIMV